MMTKPIMIMTSTLSEASRYFWVGMYWYRISQMPAQKVMMVMKMPGAAVIHAYLVLFMRSSMVVPMSSVTEARSWLLMPNRGQMLEMSPV